MEQNVLNSLNETQQIAVLNNGGPLLILAGPGSGKTRCLTHKIAYLIEEQGISPEEILAVTFTNKAANEMRERIQKLTNGTVKSKFPWIGTFHSICAKILRREGHRIGIPPGFIIYDETDQEEVVKKIIKVINISEQKINAGSVLNTISSAKNELISPTTYATLARGFFQEIAAKVYPQYQKALKDNSALDFDDLIMETIRLFEEHPTVLAHYQTYFKFILVDEYQDTNRAQYVFIKKLAETHKNICVVGDPGQSIYAWRGADIRNILQFEKDYPNAKIVKLEQNYRSTQKIITAAYELISHNASHPKMTLWTDNKEGDNIQLVEADSEVDEARFLTQIISFSDHTFSDFVVLYRTNAQSRVIEEAFLKSRIPYTIIGGTRFYERKEIKDVLAYVRVIALSGDSVALERAEKVGKRRLQKVLELKTTIGTQKLAPIVILDKVLEASQYLDLLADGTKEGESRIENVKELRSVATEFGDLHDFLENVALVQQEYMPDSQKNSDEKNQNVVRMMTLHSAKGLEFPIVFIVGFEEGLLPHSRALVDRSELEEERRLCYVGITRAKERVYLTYAQKRLFFGSTSYNEVSRFVDEIPGELIERWHM